MSKLIEFQVHSFKPLEPSAEARLLAGATDDKQHYWWGNAGVTGYLKLELHGHR